MEQHLGDLKAAAPEIATGLPRYLGSKMNAFVFQVICVCAVRRFLLLADFVAKGIAAKPARGALRRLSALQAMPVQFQKAVDQSRTPMVDDPTSAALHGRRLRSPSSRKHRTGGCRPQKGDRFARRGARSKDTRGSGVSAAVYPASATGAKRGSPSLALDAALVHTS